MKNDSDSVFLHPIETCLSASAIEAYVAGMSTVVMKRFRRLLEKVRPDVVHHHNISLLGYSVLRKLGDYLNLYTAHDYWLFCQQNSLLKFRKSICTKRNCFSCALVIGRIPQLWRYTSSFRKGLAAIDYVLAPSNFMRNMLLDEFPQLKVCHIANFAPRPGGDNLATRDEIESPYFVYLGVLEHRRGLIPFLENYSRSHLRKSVGVHFVGTGSIEDCLIDFVRLNHLEDKVLILGYLPSDEARAQLSNAAALILPSIWLENSPIVALEALSLGLPVIGSDLGGLPEIINQVDPRLVFSWNRPTSIQRSLQYAIRCNRELRGSARAAFDSYFSPEKYIQTYMSLVGRRT